jgi:hypothetical protein
VELSVVITLAQLSSHGKVRRVGLDFEWSFGIRQLEDWVADDTLAKFSEGHFVLFAPGKISILSNQVVKWPRNAAKVLDGHPVEVNKADESSNVLDACRRWPVLDGGNFRWFHPQLSGRNLVSQKDYLSDMELALFSVDRESGSR